MKQENESLYQLDMLEPVSEQFEEDDVYLDHLNMKINLVKGESTLSVMSNLNGFFYICITYILKKGRKNYNELLRGREVKNCKNRAMCFM